MANWTPEQISNYIEQQVEENIHLEYKAADSLGKQEERKLEMSKDISAFANSDGGILIYGIREYKSPKNHLPEKIDPVDRITFPKEWIEQVISSKITPKIHGLLITPLIIDNAKPNEVVYVIEIPKGNTAYQAVDKRYYRRYNFLSVPMDDWEVKDIINRQNKTICRIRFQPKFNRKFELGFHPQRGRTHDFNLIATNLGIKAICLLDCMLATNEKDSNLFVPKIPWNGKLHEYYCSNEEINKIRLGDEEFFFNKQRMPILGQTWRKIHEFSIYSDFFIDNKELLITVSTEDNRISEKLSGFEIIEE